MYKTLLQAFILVIFFSAQLQAIPGPHGPHRIRVHSIKKVKACANVITATGGIGSIGSEYTGTADITYERFLDRKGFFSISMPVMMYSGFSDIGEVHDGDVRTWTHGLYVVPSALYHPFGNGRVADLGVGLGLAVGSFNRKEDMYAWGRTIETIYHKSFSALLAEVNLDFHTSHYTTFGLHISGGPMLSTGLAKGGFVQAGIRIGGRF